MQRTLCLLASQLWLVQRRAVRGGHQRRIFSRVRGSQMLCNRNGNRAQQALVTISQQPKPFKNREHSPARFVAEALKKETLTGNRICDPSIGAGAAYYAATQLQHLMGVTYVGTPK